MWAIPADGPLQVYTQAIQNLPLFCSPEIALLNPVTASPVLGWNLSMWIAKPFLALVSETDEVLDDETIGGRFKTILTGMPNLIDNEIDVTTISPILKFWVSEIEFFNSGVSAIRKDLQGNSQDLLEDVGNGRVPQTWARFAGIISARDLTAFMLFLCEKRKFLSKRILDPLVTELRMDYIHDVTSFFAAHLHNHTFMNGFDTRKYCLEFTTGQSPKPVSDDNDFISSVVLKQLWIMNGSLEGGKLIYPKGDPQPIFTPFPEIICTIAPKKIQSPEKFFICPLYKYAFMKDVIPPSYLAMTDGETHNYVMDVWLSAERSDRYWLLNGTALYCQIPATFA
jgi:hypothetical protein